MADLDLTKSSAAETDWGLVATERFVGLVDNVRTKTTGPVLKVARALVYGLVIFVAAIMLLVLLVVGVVRVLDTVLPGNVWAAHLLLGVVCMIAGIVLWSRRRP